MYTNASCCSLVLENYVAVHNLRGKNDDWCAFFGKFGAENFTEPYLAGMLFIIASLLLHALDADCGVSARSIATVSLQESTEANICNACFLSREGLLNDNSPI